MSNNNNKNNNNDKIHIMTYTHDFVAQFELRTIAFGNNK